MKLPPIGFGTAPYRGAGVRVEMEPAVRIALDGGFRLFDLAEMYGNEAAVGRALRSADAPPRSELFVVGKLWRTNHRAGDVRRACEASLRRIGIDAFDLYLIHAPEAWRHVGPLEEMAELGWPEFKRRLMTDPEDVPLGETWEAMRALREAGLAANIGVSNFSREQIEQLGTDRPAANEIACKPIDAAQLDWMAQQNISILGYSPLRRDLLDSPVIAKLAAAHGGTAVQVVLRVFMELGIVPITSSVNAGHIRESFGALDLQLTPGEIALCASLVTSSPSQ